MSFPHAEEFVVLRDAGEIVVQTCPDMSRHYTECLRGLEGIMHTVWMAMPKQRMGPSPTLRKWNLQGARRLDSNYQVPFSVVNCIGPCRVWENGTSEAAGS